MTNNVLDRKKIYRCDAISSVDGFLSARDVLKLEMFGDDYEEGFRNFDGVISDIERLFPDFNTEELMETFDVERLEHDKEYQYSLVDWLIKLLQERCNVPKSCFSYAIWGCDTPEEVLENYDVDGNKINCYVLENAVLLQDLGPEGQLYGVAKNPDEYFEESQLKLKEGVSYPKEEIFEWLPFLNDDYSDLEKLTSDELEVAFKSDHKGETIIKSENEKVWRSAKLRNEAFIVEKAMDDFSLLTQGLDFTNHYDESIELVKKRAPSKKYLNYLFLKVLGNSTLSLAHKDIKVLDGEILRKFVSVDVSSKDVHAGRMILFCYLSFVLGKELFSSFLGLYTLKGAMSDKGEILDRSSPTQLNDVLDQFDEVSFDENPELVPVKNGHPEPIKSSPFKLVFVGAFATINNKIGSVYRKSASVQRKKEKDDLEIANPAASPISNLSKEELVNARLEYAKLGNTILDVLKASTKKVTNDYSTALRQYKDTGFFAPELSAFIFYAISNPKSSVIYMASKSFELEKFEINDIQKLANFGFDDPDLRINFLKFMKLNNIAVYDEEMLAYQENLLNELEKLSGKKLDRVPMDYTNTSGEWQGYILNNGGHYIVSNRVLGAKSKATSKTYGGEKEIMIENKEEFFNRIYEECVCASGASGISSMTPQHMMACVDQKAGDVSRFTGGNGGKKLQSDKGVLFQNDTMKVHKKKGKKGDAITGTGVVYANGKFMEALKEALDNFDWDKMELSEAYRTAPGGKVWRPDYKPVSDDDFGEYLDKRLDDKKFKKELYKDLGHSIKRCKCCGKIMNNNLLINTGDDCKDLSNLSDESIRMLSKMGDKGNFMDIESEDYPGLCRACASKKINKDLGNKERKALRKSTTIGTLTETKRAPDGTIESNKDGIVGDWTEADSQTFAYDLIDAGKTDLTERQIIKELYDHPYFKDLFEAIEESEIKHGGPTELTVGWDNIAADEIEHAAKEVYKVLQDLKNK